MRAACAAITGAYVAGVLLAQTPFKRQIDAGVHPLTYSIFVPLFFIGIGLQANGASSAIARVRRVLVLVAIATKAGRRLRGSAWSTRSRSRVGAGMISRGEVGLIVGLRPGERVDRAAGVFGQASSWCSSPRW